MTEPQIKQGNRLFNIVTPVLGTTFLDEEQGTDDHTYTNISDSSASPTELVGTASAQWRVSVSTPSDITNYWIEFHDRFHLLNITGSAKSFVTAGQYGTGASPSSWTNTEINVWTSVANNAGMTHKESRYFGSGTSVVLAPNTIYTFRAVVWCTTDATADVKHLDGTAGSFRSLIAILHPF